MLQKLQIIFKVFIISLISISVSKAELIKPRSDIKPSKVVEIQLNGLKKNDFNYKDSGIEQTWNFAHPSNKKNTGPLPNFKMMIKGNSYQMLLNHLSHSITELGSSENWAQFEVIILDKEKYVATGNPVFSNSDLSSEISNI